MESNKDQANTFEIPNMEAGNEETEECYSSVEEYFLDCCRYGYTVLKSRWINLIRSLDEVKETLQDEVDINWFDNNLNTPLRKLK